MIQHDNSYKLLFSHPQMVQDLLTGFVHEPWVSELDFSTLETASGSYVADDLRDPKDDIIWRLRFKDGWLYLYLLLEFQSSVDTHMAVRILTYIGLLYQDLIKQKQFTADGKLPPILPLVLYNGKPRWQASLNISDLIEAPPGPLRDYTPQLKYLLLDEGAVEETAPLALRNLAAALFGLEKSREPGDADKIVGLLANWLCEPKQDSLRRAFVVWIKRVLLPGRLPGVDLTQLGDLQEINTMLAETVNEWIEQWKQQGELRGELKGEVKGEAKALMLLLTKRFGPLAIETSQRLQTATAEQLERWLDRVLDAPTLADVFDAH